jgi:AcrR family transcriptional regulator
MDTTAALVAKQGLMAVTMSQVAAETGIGRATLYKYFPDVESIVMAWHERQITSHLEYLAEVRDRTRGPYKRLEAVLATYALISHEHHGSDLETFLHRGEHVVRAHQQLRDFVRDLLIEGAESGDLRDDVAPDELASYCLHALTAASSLPSKAAVRRLVRVILAGLHPGAERDPNPDDKNHDEDENAHPIPHAHNGNTNPHAHTGRAHGPRGETPSL